MDDDAGINRLASLQSAIERELEALVQLELLSDHNDAGMRALGVLRRLLVPAKA